MPERDAQPGRATDRMLAVARSGRRVEARCVLAFAPSMTSAPY
jgi:hypothetical protein